MPTYAIKGLPALFGDARRAMLLNQEQLGALLGSSKRTVQRWETGKARPYGDELAQLARHVHPHDATVAAEIAAAIGQSLESLGIVAPARPPAASPPAAPPVAPAMPRHLAVDAVVCVAAEALGAMPGAVRGTLLAAFRRARELGLSCDEVERALDDALRPAPPAAAAAAAAAAKAEPRPAKAT